jgi:hypothetical protein
LEKKWREENKGGYKLYKEAKELFDQKPIQVTDMLVTPAKYKTKFTVHRLKRKE